MTTATKAPKDKASAEWLDRYTKEETRYRQTRKSLAEAVACWVYRNELGRDELLFFAVVGRKIRVVLTDNTLDLIRDEFTNWRDAIHFAQGILATYHQPYGAAV